MGSKKHKKHKSDSRPASETEGQEKPLKLVLKVGLGSGREDGLPDVSRGSPVLEERRHKHKKKKKKRSSEKEKDESRYAENEMTLKRPLEDEDSVEEEEDDLGMSEGREEPVSQPLYQPRQDMEDSDGNSSPSRKLREPRSCTVREASDGVILKQMLNFLLKVLQNKDVNGFFAFPVTDKIAPGYSSMIANPMDFSTMASKIEAYDYKNVMEFKADFILMCNNAMTYNRPETIYYKEAKRLHVLGTRQLSKEKLLHLKKTHSFLAHITLQELGFDESGHTVDMPPLPTPEEQKEKFKEDIRQVEDVSRFDAVPQEEMGPEEILVQAQDAAKKARSDLSERKPQTDLGFLRLAEDGTTTMTVLNPWNDGMVSSKQKIISLGDYMGKLKSGTGSLFKYKEDKRNKISTETYLCYGPFSSHAPTYDSSFASCTKEESDLLLSTYEGEVGVQYAKSVQKFVENAGTSAIEMVDKLLDTLTNGQHSKARVLQEQQKRREEELAQKALQDEMIVRAQKVAEEAAAEAAKDKTQQSLDDTAQLLQELSETQKERLSKEPPHHLSSIAQPSNKEAYLANQVTNSLMNLAKQVQPADVVSVKAVRGAMGITVNPVATPRHPQDRAGLAVPSVGSQSEARGDTSANDDSDDDDDDDDDDVKDDSGDDDNESGEEGNGSTAYGEEASDLNLTAEYDDLVQHMIDGDM